MVVYQTIMSLRSLIPPLSEKDGGNLQSKLLLETTKETGKLWSCKEGGLLTQVNCSERKMGDEMVVC